MAGVKGMINPEYKRLPSEKLIPYARNSRTHSPEQVAQIAASIKEFGFTNPILIDEENGIIAGHGRLLAAQKLGIEEVPVIVMHGLTDAQKKAYVIADNKLALNAGWDDEMLRVEFAELEELGFDLELTGFSLDEIAGLEFDDGDEVGMPDLPDGDRDMDSLGTITIRLPLHEKDEVLGWLNSIRTGDPSGAILEVYRNAKR
jgi:ParB-like chromosome segregation protein Spo0J